MSEPVIVNLRVREGDSEDFDSLVVRINKHDKPVGIKWGDYIDLSLDNKHWVTPRIEPSGLVGEVKYTSIITFGECLTGTQSRTA